MIDDSWICACYKTMDIFRVTRNVSYGFTCQENESSHSNWTTIILESYNYLCLRLLAVVLFFEILIAFLVCVTNIGIVLVTSKLLTVCGHLSSPNYSQQRTSFTLARVLADIFTWSCTCYVQYRVLSSQWRRMSVMTSPTTGNFTACSTVYSA